MLPVFLVPLDAMSDAALAQAVDAWTAFGAEPRSHLSALQAPSPGFEAAAVEAAVRTHLASHDLGIRAQKIHRAALVGALPGGLAGAAPLAPNAIPTVSGFAENWWTTTQGLQLTSNLP